MDPVTVILITIGAASLVGLSWLGGYQIGLTNGQRATRRPTVADLINELPTRRPKAAKNKRKAARKAVRA
jgi:hypothetical protein